MAYMKTFANSIVLFVVRWKGSTTEGRETALFVSFFVIAVIVVVIPRVHSAFFLIVITSHPSGGRKLPLLSGAHDFEAAAEDRRRQPGGKYRVQRL